MGIQQIDVSTHWNYFLSMEDDLSQLSRWVEFNKANFDCYSIEMARLLMTCSAEVDVLAKLLCKDFCNAPRASNISKYQELLCEEFPSLNRAEVTIPRYNLTMHPWDNWTAPNTPPLWWSANNKVKHHRSEHFKQASLKNVLNSAAALFHLLVIYYGIHTGRLPTQPNLFLTSHAFANRVDEVMVIVARKKCS